MKVYQQIEKLLDHMKYCQYMDNDDGFFINMDRIIDIEEDYLFSFEIDTEKSMAGKIVLSYENINRIADFKNEILVTINDSGFELTILKGILSADIIDNLFNLLNHNIEGGF